MYKTKTTVDEIVMVEPDDWHLHLRDGPKLKSLLSMPMHCRKAIDAEFEASRGEHGDGVGVQEENIGFSSTSRNV